jgi:hypothetical protein
MPILYPIAKTAEGALNTPQGFAAREREAHALAGEAVVFVTEETGPGFETREAALEAYAGRLDDDRPGRTATVLPEAKWCSLKPVAGPAKDGRRRVRAPAHPVNRNGRRWPTPPAPTPVVWRLSVSYWKVGVVAADDALHPARKLRRDPIGEALPVGALRALASQPLRAVKPQQPLDIGLFETRLPEAPHIVMPDE